jgi:hypothetical protein
MVDCGPVARLEPWALWSASEWARYFDAEGCPAAAALWRELGELHEALDLDALVIERLISTDWR